MSTCLRLKMYNVLTILTILILSTPSESSNAPPEEPKCTCIPYYQCSEETGYVITDGTGLFDVRGFQSKLCTGYFDVCCNISKAAEVTDAPPKRKGCGFSAPDVEWSGALLHKADTETKYKCGLALIHPRVLVSAAHCLSTDHSPNNWIVRIGDSSRAVEKVIVHPKYSSGTLQNDLALLLISQEFPLKQEDNKGGVLCVPPASLLLDDLSGAATECSVSVWSEEDGGAPRVTKMPLVKRDECQKSLRRTRLGNFFLLHGSFVCAGGGEKRDTCGGDGGSPLVCPIPAQQNRFHQVGIVSWGIGCGEKNTPGVYVNLASFRDWIDEQLLLNNLDINVYRY